MAAGAVLLSAGCGDEPAQPATSVSLPASFPKDEVPLVDGTLIDAGERAQGGTTVYNVTVQAQPGGFDVAKKKLTDAGYLALGDGPEGGSRSAQFSGKGYVVTVSTVDGGAVPNAVYYLISKG
ncbi:Lipoprotein OS=Tsukamurella paurometabola (strain ATCC 8368 / DSM / CCUG 35730 / CIP 100753/ JCM 10117 / KCTC 9821 / NBRC 16120 / NCIMB 702349 / NCTC 13040)OX=521096 GN=Tpau_3713 PE=4 SV=1 [Tsukamurella paurometabola]|uniref:Uncharacterized protein n=2 Tax=Tsukamurella paurometabola TaxID=2061 RepID=D5UYI8_TSUPD|nr:conserved hypothetical protein [Tsukamurella paurometabola DSM 20162]SUP39159.1 Uncharacterised protein [Tsukamurella paurometabola]